jgi:cytoskeleton-associated protein 5
MNFLINVILCFKFNLTCLLKLADERPPAPIRGRNVPGASSGGGGDGEDGEAEGAQVDPIKLKLQQEALLPRTDIGPLLTEELMNQLGDKNWKERQAALERIEVILRENQFIEPNLAELPTALCKRLTDTNKILATSALKISEKIAVALGSQGKRYVSVMAPGMIAALSDAKETLRKAAVDALTAWFDNCGGILPFLENDMLVEALSKAVNPNVKAETCGWLSAVLNKSKPVKAPQGHSDLKALIPLVYAFVEDRNPEVRTKSQELIMPLMLHVGHSDMLRVMNKLKVSIRFFFLTYSFVKKFLYACVFRNQINFKS